MRKLFGTDGIRGRAGAPPLDDETMRRLGHAVTTQIGTRPHAATPLRICIGEDTRESSPVISAALARGVADAGGDAVLAGVLPTPALALITRHHGFSAGLMVSASHNPYHDNGVKVFDASGSKLADRDETALESLMESAGIGSQPGPDPATDSAADLVASYCDFLVAESGGPALDGMRLVLDAAHGAASRIAADVFRRCGAEVTCIGDRPNGRNINDACGSTHPQAVQREVVQSGADAGFAFDGDADRCIGVSRSGALLDGDFALYYAGKALHAKGRLPHGAIVSTVMSNLGLEQALARRGIAMRRVAVGDRYVLGAMLDEGISLGGEQSGHVIFLDHAPTGDGLLTALVLARLLRSGAGEFDDVLAEIPRLPQLLLNVRVRAKPDVTDHPALAAALARAETSLGSSGRVVLRYSGTEPLARVMVEGEDAALVKKTAEELAAVFERELGTEDV